MGVWEGSWGTNIGCRVEEGGRVSEGQGQDGQGPETKDGETGDGDFLCLVLS